MASTDFTIAEFLTWVRTKPADERYSYYDARNCAVAQFGKATGRRELIGVGDAEIFGDAVYRAVNDDDEECTFGKLAVRLAAICPVKPISDTWTKADAYLSEQAESVPA
jgi:hypothetical protein